MSLNSVAKISPLSYLQDGATALHLAAQEGKADVVRLLTEAGAQLDIQTTNVSFFFHIIMSIKKMSIIKSVSRASRDSIPVFLVRTPIQFG